MQYSNSLILCTLYQGNQDKPNFKKHAKNVEFSEYKYKGLYGYNFELQRYISNYIFRLGTLQQKKKLGLKNNLFPLYKSL